MLPCSTPNSQVKTIVSETPNFHFHSSRLHFQNLVLFVSILGGEGVGGGGGGGSSLLWRSSGFLIQPSLGCQI